MKQRLYVDLGSNMGEPVTSGSVYNAANEFTAPASCADGLGGPDLSFKWTAPMAGSYTFNTLGSALDSVLHIYTFNATSATELLGCNDEAPGTVLNSSVTLSLAAGAQLRIIVDSYEPPTSRSGAFKLNIIPNFEPCPGTGNDCRESPGTWTQGGCVYAPKAAGTSCNDGNACTLGDVCNGAGACGGQTLTCANTANATASSCSAGACTINTCAAGWADCDGVYSNGCEAYLDSNNNCGACGRQCSWPNSCNGGTCAPSCDVCENGLECCSPKRCGYAPNGASICK
ncbi:hypothetical protein D7X55_04510 [Corallococcus sp. AB049A]|nr:hypothetical protein D7Y23_18890 [Corallococcus sp. AB050B]RKI73757.1 hypothetical protein D7X55_04510 [Corallococcus sp. AB049A]